MIEFTRLADLPALLDSLPGPDDTARAAAEDRQTQLTKPPGSLGRLEDIAVFMAAWQGVEKPALNKAQALVFAGNHGICDQGVNPFPQAVTAQMVANFEAGGAAINQLCQANGADLSVHALDLDRPTADFTQTPAMREEDVITALQTGANAVDTKADILLLGEMGIGNSTVAAALAHACFGGDVFDWVGAGTGSDAAGQLLKAQVIEKALKTHEIDGPLGEVLVFGGREQAAIIGAVLQARAARIPVLLDGYICSAAVAPLYKCAPDFLAHCLIGHTSAEPGHQRLARAMEKTPILDFSMRLGEGTGAALALGIVRSALACHNGMATFAEAGVSGG